MTGPPLTTAEAAALCRMTQSAFRGAMTRARAAGDDMRRPGPDARTPLWDEAALTVWLETRPGYTNWLANRRKQ